MHYVSSHQYLIRSYGFRTHTHAEADAKGAPENIYFVRCRSEGASHYGFCFGANRLGTPRGYRLFEPTARDAEESAIAATVRDTANEVNIQDVTIINPDIEHAAQPPAIGLDTAAGLRDWTVRGGEVATGTNHPVITTRGADVFDLTIDDVTVGGGESAQIGIEIAAREGGRTREVNIKNCTIRNCRQNGIDARVMDDGNELSGIKIIDNTVYNNGRDDSKDAVRRSGIAVSAQNNDAPFPQFVMITGNHRFNTSGARTQTYGIYRRNLEISVVLHNSLWNNKTGPLGGTAGTGVDGDNVGTGNG